MSENNNPLNDFLNTEETENDLFADLPFPEPEQPVVSPTQAVTPPEPQTPPVQAAQTPSVQPAVSQPVQTVAQPPVQAAPAVPQTPPPAQTGAPQQTLFENALAQTPAAAENPDPFAAAMEKAKAQSEERLIGSFAEKEALFSYGKAKDPVTDRDITFEGLRQQYEADFPELAESKKVSWTVTYGKVTKAVTNPGSDKVYDLKAEIEKSKAFLEGIKKAKTDADKQPECLVKPRVTAKSKGEARIPAYKDYCISLEDARRSQKSIVILPSKDGRLYEMRKNDIGIFTAPAENLPEFPFVQTGFEMTLPKIPMHILMFILNFFEKLSDCCELEALVHILYDTVHKKYTMRVPKQELTHTSVHSVMEEAYPEHLIHVMDIHSHNTMPAKFSGIDDADEKATRLYAVVGRLDRVFPDITVRASCGGKFIPIRPEEVFETNFKAYPYPPVWDEQIKELKKPEITEQCLPALPVLQESHAEEPRHFRMRRLWNEIF